MFNSFNGLELKLLRLFNEFSLEDVADKIGKSKHLIDLNLFRGAKSPTVNIGFADRFLFLKCQASKK